MTACTNCGSPLDDQAKFCLTCGKSALGAAAPGFPKWAAVVAGLSVVGIITWSFAASGLLRLPGKGDTSATITAGARGTGGNLLIPGKPSEPSLALGADGGGPPSLLDPATGENPPSLAIDDGGSGNPLALPAEPSQPVVTAEQTGLPAHIHDWLEHLKRCDRRREQINSELTARFMGVPDSLAGNNETTPDQLEGFLSGRMNEADRIFAVVADEFQKLLALFRSKRPPAECVEIAGYYDAILKDTVQMSEEISEAMHSLDIGKLMGMMGGSYARIDRNVASLNRTVQRLCDQYNVPNQYRLFVDSAGSPFKGMVSGSGQDLSKLVEQYKELLDPDGDGGV